MTADRFAFDPKEVAVDAPPPPDGRPLHVEVGFGKDIRILRAAERDPEALFLGVEISRKKALSFCRKVARLGLRNVRAFQGDVRAVLAELRAGTVLSYTILFPDPWPKRKHWKHRWIQPDTAARIYETLAVGGRVTVATDHDGYRDQIREVLSGAGLTLDYEAGVVPDDDRTLFTQRFERLGESVTYQRWLKTG